MYDLTLYLACFVLGALLGYGATAIDAYGRYRDNLRQLQRYIRKLETERLHQRETH
jgi:hypothetical protein